MTGMECSRLHDLAPELALGLLDGAERAEALAHLERCAKCQSDVASLTELGEQLLLLAPEKPPPAGFESRVVDQLARLRWTALPPDHDDDVAARGQRRPRPRPRRLRLRRALMAAAAVAVVGVGSAVVVARAGDDGRGDETVTPAPEPEREPQVMASVPMMNRLGDEIGTVDLLATTPTTVRLDLAGWMDAIAEWPDPPAGPWTMEVFDAEGHHASYDLPLPADDPTPDVRLDRGDLGPVHHVSVLDGDGEIWCTGSFT